MLPAPTTVFWSRRASLIGVFRPCNRFASCFASHRSNGSGPREARSLCEASAEAEKVDDAEPARVGVQLVNRR